MNIKEVSKEIYDNNVRNGFWDQNPRNVGEMLMLVVSELSEALEAHRKGEPVALPKLVKSNIMGQEDDEFKEVFKQYVKDQFFDEIADAVIRLFDISEGLGIDLEWHIRAKMRYNSLRPYKHGKNY